MVLGNAIRRPNTIRPRADLRCETISPKLAIASAAPARCYFRSKRLFRGRSGCATGETCPAGKKRQRQDAADRAGSIASVADDTGLIALSAPNPDNGVRRRRGKSDEIAGARGREAST